MSFKGEKFSIPIFCVTFAVEKSRFVDSINKGNRCKSYTDPAAVSLLSIAATGVTSHWLGCAQPGRCWLLRRYSSIMIEKEIELPGDEVRRPASMIVTQEKCAASTSRV